MIFLEMKDCGVFWPGDPRMLVFCSAYEVPKGDTCSGDIDKTRESKNVLVAETLVLSPNAELYYNRLEEVTGSCRLSKVELNDLKAKYSIRQGLIP